MFSTLLKKISRFNDPGQSSSYEDKFFSNIVGYSDVKKVLLKSILSKEPMSILLTGPPGSAKTTFLLEIQNGLDGAYFMDGTSVSSAGLIDYLFKNNTKYLLIDEIDKMKKEDQAALLNVMETGILSETKFGGKTRGKKMKLWVFATSNDADRLSNAMRSRFMELYLKEYTFEQFNHIIKKILRQRYRMEDNLSEKIAQAVWNKGKSKDVREAIKIAKLTKSCNDIDWLVTVMAKYSKN
jgi:Holliday junction DNA helicase RuvB